MSHKPKYHEAEQFMFGFAVVAHKDQTMTVREELGEVGEKQLCEDTTGCNANPHGLGKLYRDGGEEIATMEEALDALMDGKTIEVPNAGAGSFREVFAAVGFEKVEVSDWTSSAGDWNFAVFDGMYWMPASQTNRYPYFGFRYSVDNAWTFPTKEECLEYMCQG